MIHVTPAPQRPAGPVPRAGQYSHWLVALIEPQREKRVRDWLWQEAQIPAWMPVERTVQRRGIKRVKTVVETPLLRGYLFVPAMFWDYAGLHAAKGVREFMHHVRETGPVNVLLPDAALAPLREIEASLAATAGQRRYRAGQAVRIAEGAFKGLVARVAALAGSEVVRIDTPLGLVSVPEAQIEPAV